LSVPSLERTLIISGGVSGGHVRNLVDAKRRVGSRWWGVEFLIWLETDAFAPQDFIHLGPDKQAQIGAFAHRFVIDGQPVWVPTIHGIVKLNGFDPQRVSMELQSRWNYPKQVDVQRFYEHNSKEQNISNIINYSLKNECLSYLGRQVECWPNSWRATYYTFLHLWSRGFQSLRCSIGAKGKINIDKGYNFNKNNRQLNNNNEDTFSIIHTYYN